MPAVPKRCLAALPCSPHPRLGLGEQCRPVLRHPHGGRGWLVSAACTRQGAILAPRGKARGVLMRIRTPTNGSIQLHRSLSCSLEHPQETGILHRHSSSGCAISTALQSSQGSTSCAAATYGGAACSSDFKQYLLNMFSSYKKLTVVGIAKDGHVLVGPYDANGNQVSSTRCVGPPCVHRARDPLWFADPLWERCTPESRCFRRRSLPLPAARETVPGLQISWHGPLADQPT